MNTTTQYYLTITQYSIILLLYKKNYYGKEPMMNTVNSVGAKNYIIWVDTETTGIEGNYNLLLEFAVVITDNNLNIIEEAHYIIDNPIMEVLHISSDYVKKMHTSNGLLADITNPDTPKITTPALDFWLVNLLSKYGIEGKGLLAGNSIHFDRSYIKKFLPVFDSLLSYRMLDVSAIDIAAEREILHFDKPVKNYGHRALDDIHESINELKHYKQQQQ